MIYSSFKMNLEHCLLLNKTDGKVNSTKVFILWLLQNLPYKDEEDFPCIELVILLIILVGVGGAVMLICAVVEPTWRKKKMNMLRLISSYLLLWIWAVQCICAHVYACISQRRSRIRILNWSLISIMNHFGQAGSNAIYWASRHGHVETLKFLSENKCPLDVKDKVRKKLFSSFM